MYKRSFLKFIFISLLCLLSLPLQVFAKEPHQIKTITILAEPIEAADQVNFQPGVIEIERPRAQTSAKEALAKSAVLQPKAASGSNGLLTLVPLTSTTAGRLGVSIDGFQIVDPNGSGIDLSLLPIGFAESFQYEAVFFPKKPTPLYPGGQLNVKLPQPGSKNSLNLVAGQYGEIQVGGLVNHRDRIWGAHTLQSTGVLPVVDPYDPNTHFQSKKFPAHHLSLLSKSKNDLTILSFNHRNNPGSLLKPDQVGESLQKDIQLITGYKHHIKHWDLKAHLTAKHNNTFNYSSSSESNNSSLGTLISAETPIDIRENSKANLILDHRLEMYRSDLVPTEHRHILGLGIDNKEPLSQGGELQFMLRGELLSTTHFGNEKFGLSGGVGYQAKLQDGIQPFAGLTSIHRYPDFISQFGGNFGGFIIDPNPPLSQERTTTVSIGTKKFTGNSEFWIYPFATLADNLHSLQTNNGRNQYASIDEARIWGVSSDYKYFFKTITPRVAAVWTPKRQDKNGQTIPFKPEWQIITSVSHQFYERFSYSITHRYMSERNVSGGPKLKHQNITDLRIDFEKSKNQIAFLKITNLTNLGSENYPGYPNPGRQVWVGAEVKW